MAGAWPVSIFASAKVSLCGPHGFELSWGEHVFKGTYASPCFCSLLKKSAAGLVHVFGGVVRSEQSLMEILYCGQINRPWRDKYMPTVYQLDARTGTLFVSMTDGTEFRFQLGLSEEMIQAVTRTVIDE